MENLINEDKNHVSSWREMRENMFLYHPFISVIMILITCVLVFTTMYFTIEIFTRSDLSTLQKTVWELIILSVPVLGNLTYGFFGRGN